MSRPYHFLEVNNLEQMPNPDHLPVYPVRVAGGDWEWQPAFSVKDAVTTFVRFADVRPGRVIEVLEAGQDPEKDQPVEYTTTGQRRVAK